MGAAHDEDRAKVLGHDARLGRRVPREQAGDPLPEGALGERAQRVARVGVVEEVVLVAVAERQVELREARELVEPVTYN